MARIKDYRSRRGQKHLRVLLIVLSTGVLVAAVLLLWAEKYSNQPAVSPQNIDKSNAAAPAIESVEGRYLFSGTVVLARAVERAALGNGSYDYSQPFSRLSSFHPGEYDGWLVDLECPVTTKSISYQDQIDHLLFNCRPEWLPTFSKYFNLVNLANNHTYDMGVDGLPETQQHLRKAGIQTVGNYDPAVSRDVCEVIALPVRVRSNDNKLTKGTLPVAFCAWHYFARGPRAGEMELMTAYAKVMPVFAFMHVGVEYLPVAGMEQVDIAHKLINLGAEFVIGNSPHWVQNAEAYKGKLIVYSTGNFIFDQLDAETNRGLSLDVSIKAKQTDNLARWMELGEKCKKSQDDCLEEAKELNLKKLDLEFEYNPVASQGGNREITHKANTATQKAVEERLGWDEVLRKLDDKQ